MKISVIIPTLNEAQIIEQAVNRSLQAGADEVIVADGGSTDETVSNAESAGCETVSSAAGRGIQLNAGAKRASGDFFLFLHADTYLGTDGCSQIRDAASRGVMCGAFRQRIESNRPIYRLIEIGNALRVTWMGMAYGDQGIFISRSVFESLGGFDVIPLMEDFEFSRKLKSHRHRYCLCPGPLFTSARRWELNGPIWQTISNWKTVGSYLGGSDIVKLARRYHRS